MPEFDAPFRGPSDTAVNLMARPLMDFLGGLPSTFREGKIEQAKVDLLGALKNIPITDAQGNINPQAYGLMAQAMAQHGGNANVIADLLATAQTQQAQTQDQALYGPAGAAPTGGAPGAAAATPAAPSVRAPLPPVSGNTLNDMVKSVYSGSPTDAATIATNIGRALNIGPGDPVPADKRDVAQRYVQSYAERTGTRAPGLQHGPEIAQQTQIAEQKYGVSSDLLQRQIHQESGGDPSSTSPKGAAGVSQFIPETAARYGVNVRSIPSSVDGQARYMKDLLARYNGNEGLALAGYNWGEGNVDKWLRGGRGPPPETRNYVQAITGQSLMAWARGGTTSGAVAANVGRASGASKVDASGNEIVVRSGGVRAAQADRAPPASAATGERTRPPPSAGAVTPPAPRGGLTEEALLASPRAQAARAAEAAAPSGRVAAGFGAMLPGATPAQGATAPAAPAVAPPVAAPPVGGAPQAALPPNIVSAPAPPQAAPVAAPAQPAAAAPPPFPLVPEARLPNARNPYTGENFQLTGDPRRDRRELMDAATFLENRAGRDPKQAHALQAWAKDLRAMATPFEIAPGRIEYDPLTGQQIQQPAAPGRGGLGAMATPERVNNIADGIENGILPPDLKGFYTMKGPVEAELAGRKFDLSKATLEWNRAQKMIQSLNGPQMTRFVGLANSVQTVIGRVRDLSEELNQSGITPLNRTRLEWLTKFQGNTPQGQLATAYLSEVGVLKEEFANLANGGYAPTEPAWKLANTQVNENYGVQQFDRSLGEIQRAINYRLHAIPGMTEYGPGSPSRYTPGAAQPQAPVGGAEGAAPAAAGAPATTPGRSGLPAPLTKAEYERLKSGDQYKAPDGSIRTKP